MTFELPLRQEDEKNLCQSLVTNKPQMEKTKFKVLIANDELMSLEMLSY